jgi:hypothetical protein
MQTWWCRLSEVKVIISSPYGNATPANGVAKLKKDSIQTFSIEKSPITITEEIGWGIKWKKVMKCTGWTGSGSVPVKGIGTSVTFPLTEDSTITWNWIGSSIGSQILSITAFLVILAIALVAVYWSPHAFVLAISAGALGGLAHEIVQSGGKYVLPNSDEKGNFCLGGLIGIVTGGVAGLLMYQGLMATAPVSVSMSLVVEALVAGLAVKGIADAPNPK